MDKPKINKTLSVEQLKKDVLGPKWEDEKHPKMLRNIKKSNFFSMEELPIKKKLTGEE